MLAGSADRLSLSLSTSASNQGSEQHAQEQPRRDDGFTDFRDRDLGYMHTSSVNGNVGRPSARSSLASRSAMASASRCLSPASNSPVKRHGCELCGDGAQLVSSSSSAIVWRETHCSRKARTERRACTRSVRVSAIGSAVSAIMPHYMEGV